MLIETPTEGRSRMPLPTDVSELLDGVFERSDYLSANQLASALTVHPSLVSAAASELGVPKAGATFVIGPDEATAIADHLALDDEYEEGDDDDDDGDDDDE